MTGREAKTQYRIREWAERFRERSQSGQTVRSWCSDNGVSNRTYYYWLRRVREYAAQVMSAAGGENVSALAPVTAFKELAAPQAPAAAKLSVPDGWAVCALMEQPKLQAKTLPIEIGKCRVLADEDVDPELLAKFCKALVSIC